MSLVRTGTHPIFAANGSGSASNLARPWSTGALSWALKLRLGAALRNHLTEFTLVAMLGGGLVATEA